MVTRIVVATNTLTIWCFRLKTTYARSRLVSSLAKSSSLGTITLPLFDPVPGGMLLDDVKPAPLISATAIGLIVTASVLTDTWLFLLMASAGALFVVFAIGQPKAALLLWLLAAPVANAYATVNLPGIPDIMFGRVTIAVVAVALLIRVIVKGRPLGAFGAVEFVMLVLLAVMTLDLMRSGSPSSDA